MLNAHRPIALFDSGVGGLSVLRHIRTQLPAEDILYLADQANVPYGSRTPAEIRKFCKAITQYLLALEAKIIVVACNTASGAALTYLRRTFPETAFVGMEPAVKPAALQTKRGKVGVLATAGTFKSQRYEALMARFARDVQVFENPCLGLVELIEDGRISGDEVRELLQECVHPMLTEGVDALVLGCTHYPFVQPLLAEIVGTSVAVIDPAPAVARQSKHVLEKQNLLAEPGSGNKIRAFSTGAAGLLADFAQGVLGLPLQVESLVWDDGRLRSAK